MADDAALDLEEVDALPPPLLDARRVVVVARWHRRCARRRSRERERRRRRAVLRIRGIRNYRVFFLEFQRKLGLVEI